MIPVVITSREGDNKALVNEHGELVIGDIASSTAANQEMSVVDTAYNFIAPSAGKEIVLTGFTVWGNKNVSATVDATVVIYSNSVGPADRTQTEVLFKTEITKQDSLVVTGINLSPTSKGVWVNAETDDATVFLNIFYYYR